MSIGITGITQKNYSHLGLSGCLMVQFLNMDFDKSEIYMIIKRGTDVCLEKINLSTDTAEEIPDANHPILLDRRIKLQTGGTTTIPYTDPDVIYVQQDGAQIPLTVAAFTGGW